MANSGLESNSQVNSRGEIPSNQTEIPSISESKAEIRRKDSTHLSVPSLVHAHESINKDDHYSFSQQKGYPFSYTQSVQPCNFFTKMHKTSNPPNLPLERTQLQRFNVESNDNIDPCLYREPKSSESFPHVHRKVNKRQTDSPRKPQVIVPDKTEALNKVLIPKLLNKSTKNGVPPEPADQSMQISSLKMRFPQNEKQVFLEQKHLWLEGSADSGLNAVNSKSFIKERKVKEQRISKINPDLEENISWKQLNSRQGAVEDLYPGSMRRYADQDLTFVEENYLTNKEMIASKALESLQNTTVFGKRSNEIIAEYERPIKKSKRSLTSKNVDIKWRIEHTKPRLEEDRPIEPNITTLALKRPTLSSRKSKQDSHIENIERSKQHDAVQQEKETKKEAVEMVDDFYSLKKHMNVTERKELKTYRIRIVNNWIKSILINVHTNKEEKDFVLDIGCGKGGDLSKWHAKNIRFYIGIDLSASSIADAESRYHKLKKNRRDGAKTFEAKFRSADCFVQPIAKIFEEKFKSEDFIVQPIQSFEKLFNVVSMQFCLHYAFENQHKAKQIFANVGQSLKKGGYFIGTIPCSDFIEEKIATLDENKLEFGNEFYRVRFETLPTGIWNPPYGHKYYYTQEEAVDTVPEFVVPFATLRSLAEEQNLNLIWHKPFRQIFQEYRHIINDLKNKNDEKASEIDLSFFDGPEGEAVNFYTSFVFKKG